MLKKRMPTPKTGPKGRAYEACHLAWRAGLIRRWHLMEDGTWSLDLGDGAGRRDGLSVAECHELVTAHVTASGIQEIALGTAWLGYRTVLVTVHGHTVESRRPGDRPKLEVVA